MHLVGHQHAFDRREGNFHTNGNRLIRKVLQSLEVREDGATFIELKIDLAAELKSGPQLFGISELAQFYREWFGLDESVFVGQFEDQVLLFFGQGCDPQKFS